MLINDCLTSFLVSGYMVSNVMIRVTRRNWNRWRKKRSPDLSEVKVKVNVNVKSRNLSEQTEDDHEDSIWIGSFHAESLTLNLVFSPKWSHPYVFFLLSIARGSSVKTQLIYCQLKWRHVSTQEVIIRPIIEPCLRYIKWKCTMGSQNVYNSVRTWVQLRLIFTILYIIKCNEK